MQWNTSLLCNVWLFLLCFGPVCPSAVKHSKCRHDRHAQIHQKTHKTKKFCDPSSSSQAAGALTQRCSSGFYREQVGPHRGQCVPCSCSGLSTECDEQTGNCVNCQFNTTGDRCECCKEGYYGNAAKRTCHVCPCPSTKNNFALACLDIGSGVVQCLCKRGYIGARCEKCAFGYYGNPGVGGGSCKPCNCKDGTICDSLTGECITSGNSSCADHCPECDSCTAALLLDLGKVDHVLARPAGSITRLNHLETNISDTKIVVWSYRSAVKHLHPQVEQLEADVHTVGDDMSQVIDKALGKRSDLEKVLQNVNETKTKAEDVLSEAEAILTAMQDLTEVKPAESVTLSEQDKARMLEEAERIVQELRMRGCAAQRDKAGREQQEAHTLLDIIRNTTAPVESNRPSFNQTDWPLWEVTELLSNSEETVDRTQGLNRRSLAVLRHLEDLHTQLQGDQSNRLHMTEMTRDLQKNITDIQLMLEDIKKEFENHAAQLDGGKLGLLKKLNHLFQMMSKVNSVIKAEEHAEELSRAAALVQQVLHNPTSSTDLLSALVIGANNEIINVLEKAEAAATQSREAAEQALKDVTEGGLVDRAGGLRENSTHLWTEANETHGDFKLLSDTANTHSDRATKQKEKGESLRNDISTTTHDIKKIKRDNTNVLIDSAKTAASASNSTVWNLSQRLRNISQEVERITLTNITVNIDEMLFDADQAVNKINRALPALNDKITQVEALSRKAPPNANMTESIRRIKDVIEETRNYVNRLSAAATFNGKGHVELRPPRNLEDIKAFTAVDLLINRHQNNPSKADHRRKRRQDKAANLFVFYLGNKDPSGDYIGMAVRSKVLVCVYKLGGVVHEVETSQITTTTNVNSSDFDRVLFHRVYQDAEVNITQNFTSRKPVSLPPKRNLPNTATNILHLDPDSVVFYVGGYPEHFTPPVELLYPKYKGAMKLSYINDNSVSLFNYKHAVNMSARQPAVEIPSSEVSDYYEGTGYRMAIMKEPDKIKRRLFKFHTNSRETNALLFFIGNDESFLCLFLERGFLVLQGQQTGRKLRLQTVEKVSLLDKHFAISLAGKFIVRYGSKEISTDHNQTKYRSYYIGGLPAPLRQRHNITAPPLRGCVDHLTANADIVEYNKTIGVSDGCPVSLLGIRSATLYSALSADSLFVWSDHPLRVSLGFRTTDRHGPLLRSSSEGSPSAHDFQLALADGYAVFNSGNYTLRSDKRYSDGSWHYLSAIRKTTGLELIIDNVKVTQPHSWPLDQNLQGGTFTGCIANLYTRRPELNFTPADLSSVSLKGEVVLGLCSLLPPPHTEVTPAPVLKSPQKHKPIQAPAGSQCRRGRVQPGEYQLSEDHSWLSYTLPQEDLNHRPHFSLDIKTKSSKGLIFHIAGRGVIPLLALYLANGKIKMTLGHNRIIQHKQKSNDGNWHRVEFSVEKSTFHLLVDGVRVNDGHLPNNEGSSLDLHNPVYLGGDPISNTKGHNVPMNSVIGCIQALKMNEEVIGEPEKSHRIRPCFEKLTEMGTYFGGGYIILDNYFPVGSQFVLAFEFRPQHLTGLLFHVQSHKTSLSLVLKETRVVLKVNAGKGAVSVSVTPPQSLCDGKFHIVTVSKQLGIIKLEVDSMSEQKAVLRASTSYSTTLHTLYIGGTAKQNQVSVSSPYVGCLRNVELNGKPVELETGSRVVGPATINRCPAV